jgi:hypothetical protein
MSTEISCLFSNAADGSGDRVILVNLCNFHEQVLKTLHKDRHYSRHDIFDLVVLCMISKKHA